MKPGFYTRLLNGYFEDPCLFIRIPYMKNAILFDLGNISILQPKEMYKITDVFVTHTHIDHFIGFDILLRSLLRREIPLNVYGPVELLSCVQGKLRGYTWNLISDYPLVINVFTYDGKNVSHFRFSAINKFQREDVGEWSSDGTILENSIYIVRTLKLDHGIPCLAYTIEEKFHINIDRAMLSYKGLKVGPWLNDFKKMIRDGYPETYMIRLDNQVFSLKELFDIARITKGQKISYATDISLNQQNIDALVDFIKDSDIFYCEAYFLEKDRERAIKRSHLTAKKTGIIARMANVKKLFLMHFSPKYIDCPEKVIEEAMNEYYKKFPENPS